MKSEETINLGGDFKDQYIGQTTLATKRLHVACRRNLRRYQQKNPNLNTTDARFNRIHTKTRHALDTCSSHRIINRAVLAYGSEQMAINEKW